MLAITSLTKHRWFWPAANALAGATVPISFAPFNLWPIAILAVAVLSFSLFNNTTKRCYALALCFGVGMFATGASWVFVSIHVFGKAPVPFAILLTLLFIALLASVFALPFLIYGRWCAKQPINTLLVIPALWCLSEWLRTWLFTGFPWLFLGYGHIDTWLAGWAPIVGVMGISFWVALTGSALAYGIITWPQKRYLATASACIATAWLGGLITNHISWTQDYQEPVSVGIAQGNVPQDKKWDDEFVTPTLERYFALSEKLWENDWVVWPEAAIPLIVNYRPHSEQLTPAMEKIQRIALENNAAFITGILYLSPRDAKFYNSIVATGLGSGIYHKQRLAPFGDYVPLSEWFGPVLALFNLPHSRLQLGPPNQRGLQVGGAIVSAAICYEVAYPDLVAKGAQGSHALITVSNDAWFGSSLGPIQHMQIAQMRALENQRYLIRSTNNGISGIVDDRGQLLVRSEQFVHQSISGEVVLKQGLTPFMRWGSEPIVFLSLVLVGMGIFYQRKQAGKHGSSGS